MVTERKGQSVLIRMVIVLGLFALTMVSTVANAQRREMSEDERAKLLAEIAERISESSKIRGLKTENPDSLEVLYFQGASCGETSFEHVVDDEMVRARISRKDGFLNVLTLLVSVDCLPIENYPLTIYRVRVDWIKEISSVGYIIDMVSDSSELFKVQDFIEEYYGGDHNWRVGLPGPSDALSTFGYAGNRVFDNTVRNTIRKHVTEALTRYLKANHGL